MKFDNVVGNPPYLDTKQRNTTPHKLWIDFTRKSFSDWLKDGGYLIQVSPSSFSSPSSKILQLFKDKKTHKINFNQEHYFPDVGTTVATYVIENSPTNAIATMINDIFKINLNHSVLYIPNDFCQESFSIHSKVLFASQLKLNVERDYVTGHNIRLKDENSTLSKEETEHHIHPMFHSNRQVWYSSILQSFAKKKKVIWTRSGYTKPFYDDGKFGVTDLSYYVEVTSDTEGKALTHNLNTRLFKYIFNTARWSGFGNDKVFYALPQLPNKPLTNIAMYNHFSLTKEERSYVESNTKRD